MSAKIVPIEHIANAVRVLAANRFDRLNEARVFCATIAPKSMADLVRQTGLPFSTVSRICWDLKERGLMHYGDDARDRRKTILRARIENLKG